MASWDRLTLAPASCDQTRNPVRRCAIWVVDSRLFDRFILLVILVNCVFLALVDPTQPKGRQDVRACVCVPVCACLCVRAVCA